LASGTTGLGLENAGLIYSSFLSNMVVLCAGEHQYEILDFVAAKFHEELGVFKLLVIITGIFLLLLHICPQFR